MKISHKQKKNEKMKKWIYIKLYIYIYNKIKKK